MILSFNYFHALTGEPPNTLSWVGSDIVARARDLLQQRSYREIKAGLKAINWMLSSPAAIKENLKLLEREICAADATSQETPSRKRKQQSKTARYREPVKRDLTSCTYQLLRCADEVDIAGFPDFSNATWMELFAILSLGLIEKACDDEQYYGKWPHDKLSTDWLHYYRIETQAAMWLVEAMNAVSAAEGFKRQLAYGEQIQMQEKKKRSVRLSNAAIARHSKTNDAVIAIKELYLSEGFTNRRHAVSVFCTRYPDKVEHLKPLNRMRTLAERLGKDLRGRPPLPRTVD